MSTKLICYGNGVQISRWRHCWRRRRFHSRATVISASEARQTFLEFFVKNRGHTYVRPSSVIAPDGDPSLLFTNAGMNQFKSRFLGASTNAVYCTAANSQKCIRVGGKHNDLGDVGRDGYHHTFFEMLGSWSFDGHYFKEEACRMAWELLTGSLRIPLHRLYVTYFEGDSSLGLEPDHECRDVWLRIGVPADRILPFGTKDNFWEMGNAGPCGPCTEIHYCHCDMNIAEASRLVNAGRADVIELWNLVFVQYNRMIDGSLTKLSKFHIDTGMGLERLAAVLCGSTSNYDTDLFKPIFDAIHKESDCRPYKGLFCINDVDGMDTAYRVIADHARMCAVSIADGLIPDEYGAGHCLRRIIRRAVLASLMTLKTKNGLLGKLLPHVTASLGDIFPEVQSNLTKSVDIVQEEEDKFLKILGKGLKLFEVMCIGQNVANVFPAENMCSLVFGHGLPEDLILDLCASRGLIPDLNGFNAKLLQEKIKSTNAHRLHLLKNQSAFEFDKKATDILKSNGIPPTDDSFKYNANFINNDLRIPNLEAKVVAIWNGERFERDFSESERTVGLILNRTNFYAEAGGQMPDHGIITSLNTVFKVTDVQMINNYIVHRGILLKGSLQVDSETVLNVDESRRAGCTRNHTATHLLHVALQKTLGETSQKSSSVAPNYLRFDFAVKRPLKRDQFLKVESILRDIIERRLSVQRIELALSEVTKFTNLITLTGTNYPDPVTVVAVVDSSDPSLTSAISLEACGGTHVTNTVDLMDFVIVSQKSVSQVSRSIKAVTGVDALQVRRLGQRIENDVDNFEGVVANMESGLYLNDDIFYKLGALRASAAEDDIPQVCREPLDERIDQLKQRIIKIIRKLVKNEFQQVVDSNTDYFIHSFNVGCSEPVVFAEVAKFTSTLPSCVFVTTSGRIHCQFRVPKNLTTDTFNAQTWASFVEPILGCSQKTTSRNTTVVAQRHNGDPQRLKQALEAADQFVKSNFSTN